MASRRSDPATETRRFEMPYGAVPGRLVNPEIGLASMSLRGGEAAPYTIDVTILDAPDHRLIRAGIWLAHRIVDGRGEWYLAAPEWSPWLPEERVEHMGEVDLPDALAALIRPFRRGSTIGPVAALSCLREEYAVRGPRAELLAVLRDDKVTIRSGGLTTARYREVTLRPGSRLEVRQAGWLTEMLTVAGATRVAEFPPLAHRLGVPSTGSGDFAGGPADPSGSLEAYLGHLIAGRLLDITRGDLALRGGEKAARAIVVTRLAEIRGVLRGLTPLIDTRWAEDLAEETAAVVALLTGDPGDAASASVLDCERYLHLLDRLVWASRTPLVDAGGRHSAGYEVAWLLRRRVQALRRAVGRLSTDAEDAAWQAALDSAQAVLDCCGVQPERRQHVAKLYRRVARLADRLDDCVQAAVEKPDLRPVTVEEAFELGRGYERLWGDQQIARADFLDAWERWQSRIVVPRKPVP